MTNTASAKAVVRDFLETVFVEHDIEAGFARCVGPSYRQHNPGTPDGLEGFKSHFQHYFAQHPQAGLKIHRMFCEGDYVTAHLHWWEEPGEAGWAVIDIFRLEQGRIVEHWDVMQPVPSQQAHGNTMF